MEQIRAWLDDVRPAPTGEISGPYVHYTTAEVLLADIEQYGLDRFDEISFDNDLGTGNMEGYQLLDHIEKLVFEQDLRVVPWLWCHSGNPVAAAKMYTVIRRINEGRIQR